MPRLIISEYEVEGYDDPVGPPTIVRHTSPFYQGVKWAMKWRNHHVLGKDGKWAWEPQPSSRDDEFYAKYRFDSVDEALNMLLTSTDKDGPKIMPPIKLITKAQWDELTSRSKGYTCYIQGALLGSELEKDWTGPYPLGSKEAKEFAAGEFTAMMDAQEAT